MSSPSCPSRGPFSRARFASARHHSPVPGWRVTVYVYKKLSTISALPIVAELPPKTKARNACSGPEKVRLLSCLRGNAAGQRELHSALVVGLQCGFQVEVRKRNLL